MISRLSRKVMRKGTVGSTGTVHPSKRSVHMIYLCLLWEAYGTGESLGQMDVFPQDGRISILHIYFEQCPTLLRMPQLRAMWRTQ